VFIVRQSTARTVTVGPILDADGVAVTDGVVGDMKISKNGAAPAALNGSATLTHRHTGFYSLALTASDLDTVGTAEVTIDDTVNACPMKELSVIEEAVYDALFAASATGRLGIFRTSTAQAGSTTTITLDASASAVDDFYNACQVAIISGTGAGQVRMIADYVGSTKVATIDIYRAWATAPDNTSVFEILPAAGVPLSGWGGVTTTSLLAAANIGGGTTLPAVYARVTHLKDDSTAATNAASFFDGTGYAGTNNVIPTVTTVNGLAANTVTASALAADAVTEIQSGLATAASITALNNLSAAQVNAEVLDVLNTDTFAQPAGVPSATVTLAEKIGRLYQMATSEMTVTATARTFYTFAGAALWKQTLADDGTVFSATDATSP
jgi:hypothetical protein